jgi:hypothetical protein
VTDLSVPVVIEAVNVGLRSFFMAPASDPRLTNCKVHEAIRDLRVAKARGPNGIQNRVFKHLPQRTVSLLVLIFNAILLTHHFLTARSIGLDTQTWEGSSTAIIMSTH